MKLFVIVESFKICFETFCLNIYIYIYIFVFLNLTHKNNFILGGFYFLSEKS